jgi:hypothetical protein
MLFLHWKQARFPLLPFVVAAFGLPLFSIQEIAPDVANGVWFSSVDSPFAELSLPIYPALAILTGVVLALTAWNWDHQMNHVYALSLPLARWEYAMLKMGAGAVLALIPTAAIWIGAQLASASVVLPEGLHAYPNELTFRFFLAVLLSYALVFALASGTTKTASWVMGTVVGVVVFGSMVFEAFGVGDLALQSLWSAGGPLEVFTGSWALFDV